MTNPAIFINCFEVPAGREDEFAKMWETVNKYMAQKPGFISNQLHRANTPDARFRFVNYVKWRTVEDWRAAHDEGFRALVQKPEWDGIKYSGATYDVVSRRGIEASAA
jgi:heme-degrading monooxygenase HmoA